MNSQELMFEGDNFRLDYDAARNSGGGSRLSKARSTIMPGGIHADYHVRNEMDIFRMAEVAWDMTRNDLVIGPAIEKLIDYALQGGFILMPKLADRDVNDEIQARFASWASDPSKCDADGEHDFAAMQEIAFRGCYTAGEQFAILQRDRKIMMIEQFRCRQPSSSSGLSPLERGVLGVVLGATNRKREAFYFLRDEKRPEALIRLNDVVPVRAYDTNRPNLRTVLQVYDPRRCTQTRGVTALAPVIKTLDQLDSSFYAKLVQQHSSSIFAFIVERGASYEPGTAPRGNTEVRTDEKQEEITWERYGPGTILRSGKGEQVKPFAPNIISGDFVPYIKMMLQLVNIHLKLPLVLYLLDASETNFSGWKGAVNACQVELKRVQNNQKRRYNNHVYRWWLTGEMQEDPAFAREVTRAMPRPNDPESLYAHDWRTPAWKQIQPLEEANADALRRGTLQISPRAAAAERGVEYEDMLRETVEDNKRAIEAALTASKEIRASFGDLANDVSWRECLTLPQLANVKINTATPAGETPPAPNRSTANERPQ